MPTDQRPTDKEILDKAIEEAAELGSPRCAFIEKALSLPGLAYENGGDNRDAYVRELLINGIFDNPTPADIKQAYAQAAAMSTCGLTTRAIWRYAGVDMPDLYKPYGEMVAKGRYAVAEEYNFARKVGAWVDAIPWRRGTPFPVAGDAMIIGIDHNPAYARGNVPTLQHELNVVAWVEGPQGALMGCVDGGQPGIAFRTRGLVEVFPGGGDAGELWCGAVNPDGSVPLGGDGRPLNGRRAIGFTSVDKLPFRSGKPPSCKGSSWRDLIWWALAAATLGAAALEVAPLLSRRS